MKTIADILPEVSARDPNQTALVEGDTRLSYGELCARAQALGRTLRELGIETGSRVALLLPNGIDFVTAYFGIAAAGAIIVPLNDGYQETELEYFTRLCDISLLVTSRRHEELCRRVLAGGRSECRPFFMEGWVFEPGKGTRADVNWVDAENPVMFQFSSGSTGTPKRIARRHHNLLFELESFVRTLGIRTDDRFLGVAPFSHVNGLMRSMMASMYAGATLYPLERFERQRVAEVIERERITIMIAVPFMFGMLAKSRFDPVPDFSTLRLCVSASAPMPKNLNLQFHGKFGRFVRQLYGSTETGTISVNLTDDPSDSLESVGLPMRGVSVDVLSDSGDSVPADEMGELVVRSPAAIAGYEDLPEVNRESFRDGYFLTGDLGRKDASGYLYLLGRKKFFINKGGYKINPQEIEQLLEQHPAVEEVAVVGVPTQFEDEKVKAVVVKKNDVGTEELVEFCRGKIADFKIPATIEFRDSLPKSSTGKVRKKLLI